jgi:hypothetical protein
MTVTVRTSPLLPPLGTDETGARRAMREQIVRLDGELSALVLSAWPAPVPPEILDAAAPATRATGARPALLTLAELERARDDLAERTAAVRRALDAQGQRQEEARRAREEIMLDPAAHRWARVTNADLGEPGCRDWHVRPRFGLLGMLMSWWRVHISSGCPRPGGGPRPPVPTLARCPTPR